MPTSFQIKSRLKNLTPQFTRRFLPNAAYALTLSLLAVATQAPPLYATESTKNDTPSLDHYIEALEQPQTAWSHMVREEQTSTDPSRSLSSLPSSNDQRPLRAELEKMLKQYAPRIWFHPDEKYGPMDPVKFVENSTLWFRNLWAPNRLVAKRGEIKPHELGLKNSKQYSTKAQALWMQSSETISPFRALPVTRPHQSGGFWNGEGYYLKYEGKPEGVLKDIAKNAPMLWRVSAAPSSKKLQAPASGQKRILIEYWYHLGFSHASKIGIGNHQGDWEGMAMLVDIGTGSDGKLRHRLRASYFATHDNGRWHCPSELSWTPAQQDGPKTGRFLASLPSHSTDGPNISIHPEAFSAKGTHATYPAEGKFSGPFFSDITGRGYSWDTWENLKPMALEPYYGFSGAWGDASIFGFMTGPLAPGPSFKFFPKNEVSAENIIPEEAITRCSLMISDL